MFVWLDFDLYDKVYLRSVSFADSSRDAFLAVQKGKGSEKRNQNPVCMHAHVQLAIARNLLQARTLASEGVHV